MIKQEKNENHLEFSRRLHEAFPKETITAKLISNDKTEITLIRGGDLARGGISINSNKKRIEISLVPSGEGVPTDIKFNKVIITSSIELKDVSIYWRNFKH